MTRGKVPEGRWLCPRTSSVPTVGLSVDPPAWAPEHLGPAPSPALCVPDDISEEFRAGSEGRMVQSEAPSCVPPCAHLALPPVPSLTRFSKVCPAPCFLHQCGNPWGP